MKNFNLTIDIHTDFNDVPEDKGYYLLIYIDDDRIFFTESYWNGKFFECAVLGEPMTTGFYAWSELTASKFSVKK